jgi:hypothetical protein
VAWHTGRDHQENSSGEFWPDAAAGGLTLSIEPQRSCLEKTMSPEIRIARTRIQAAVLLGVVVLARPGCAGFDGETGVLEKGTWGGEHMLLELDDAFARVEFDCAHGTIALPILLAEGEFSAPGTFVQEHGGPIREGEDVVSLPARYYGRVRADLMTVTVLLSAEKRTIGTFELRRGQQGRVFKCL